MCNAGKLLAFSGPSNVARVYYGFKSFVPDDYCEYFKQRGVTAVVRLNKPVSPPLCLLVMPSSTHCFDDSCSQGHRAQCHMLLAWKLARFDVASYMHDTHAGILDSQHVCSNILPIPGCRCTMPSASQTLASDIMSFTFQMAAVPLIL